MTATATLSDREVEHIAWTVLVCALAGFLILLIGLPAHGTSEYTQGSYSLEVTSDQSEVVVRSGQANLATGNGKLTLNTRERGQLHAAEQPRGPFPAQRDLIADGAFQATLDNWRAYND